MKNLLYTLLCLAFCGSVFNVTAQEETARPIAPKNPNRLSIGITHLLNLNDPYRINHGNTPYGPQFNEHFRRRSYPAVGPELGYARLVGKKWRFGASISAAHNRNATVSNSYYTIDTMTYHIRESYSNEVFMTGARVYVGFRQTFKKDHVISLELGMNAYHIYHFNAVINAYDIINNSPNGYEMENHNYWDTWKDLGSGRYNTDIVRNFGLGYWYEKHDKFHPFIRYNHLKIGPFKESFRHQITVGLDF